MPAGPVRACRHFLSLARYRLRVAEYEIVNILSHHRTSEMTIYMLSYARRREMMQEIYEVFSVTATISGLFRKRGMPVLLPSPRETIIV